MSWNLAIWALATVTVISLLAGFLGGRGTAEQDYRGPLHDYLLANQGLERQSVIQLLLSTSFSLNGMLYQVWLGYSIGLWALAVQGAWALSYVLLAHYVASVREAKSLHSFLGGNFGERTRVVAGLCSIIGFTVLIGWEFNVGKSTFEGLLSLNSNQTVSAGLVLLFMIATVFASFLYTAIGGLRGNAFANLIQNTIKFVVFVFMFSLLYKAISASPSAVSIQSALFPSISQVIINLGVFGLITNLAFSLVWQFVDMSTWQSVIASKRKLDESNAKSALRMGGLAVFIAPGVVGTFLGAFLAGTPGVDGNNVMAKLVSVLPYDNPILLFVVYAALLASIMSMIDGLLLAAAYSLVCDLIHRHESLEQLDANESRAQGLLTFIRLCLGLIAVLGTLGVFALVDGLKISLFDIVYVLIICQLALTGPILFGLWGKFAAGDRMVWAIVVGLLVGFGSFICSRGTCPEWLLTGAGFFTMLASLAVAELVTRSRVTQP